MGSKGIEKVDLCVSCFNKKAEYLFWHMMFGGIKIRLLCKDCAKTTCCRERIDM